MNTATPPQSSRSSRGHSNASFPPAADESSSPFRWPTPRHRALSLDWHGPRSPRAAANFNLNQSESTPTANHSHSPLSMLSPPRRHRTPASNNNNRTRASSHDHIILNIVDVLPSYDNELAERIDSITEDDVRSFQSGAALLSMTSPLRRGRAHTSPRITSLEENSAASGSSSSSYSGGDLAVSMNSPARASLQQEDDNVNSVALTRNRANTCPETEEETTTSGYEHGTTQGIQRSSRTPAPAIVAMSPSLVLVSPSRRSHSAIIPTTTTPISTTTSISTSPRPHCIFRYQNLLRSLMLLSLYMTLHYTWNNDLRLRYKSVEINDGLNEYWTGGDIFTLMNSNNGNDDVKERLSLNGDGKKRKRPSLSHARSLDMVKKNGKRNHYVGFEKSTATAATANHWSFAKCAWMMVCFGFMIPIAEAGWGEVRRYLGLRRLRLRSSVDVHDL